MIPTWHDLFKLWSFARAFDPASRLTDRVFPSAGTSQPDAVPDIRQDGSFWGGDRGSLVRLRESNDFIDLSTVTNRQARYREYERLRNVAEIEFAMNVFSDEACVAGSTKIATPYFGLVPISWLAENKAGERFAVYCWDFEKNDFTIGWAFDPRFVKEVPTIKLLFEDGTKEIVTDDHLILMSTGEWKKAGDIKPGEGARAFYRIPARQDLTGLPAEQFPRIYSHAKGWMHERQFLDEWRTGQTSEQYEKINKTRQMLAGGMSIRHVSRETGYMRDSIERWLKKTGFTKDELVWLGKKPVNKGIINIVPGGTTKVYDLSVEKHLNFCTDSIICHNCQKGEHGYPFEVVVEDSEVKKELELLFHNKRMPTFLDQKRLWNYFKNLFIFGDLFLELVINPDSPSDGLMNIMPLPPDSVYRIETTKGKLIEFQQGKEGPDLISLAKVDVTKATRAELMSATCIRFTPDQIVHIKIGDDRRTFYPYGISLIEAARGPAHQLRLMEDAMVIYRLIRAPERRVFFIDVHNLPPFRAEAFIDRLKDQLRKKKVVTNRNMDQGGSGKIEERWHSQPMDEDFWIPVRPNSQTRIETLPGACIILDTMIPLLDGRELTLQQIIDEFNQGKQLWAYSCNPQTGEPAPGLITWAGITRKNTQVVKVNLDNGKSITCTPDHKFPTWNKGKVEAQNLEAGDSLISWNVREKPLTPSKSRYLQIYDHSKKSYVFVHRMIAEYVKDTPFYQEQVFNEKYKDANKKVIHHKNIGIRGNKFNNTPENLAWMNWHDHKLLHQENRDIMNKNIGEALKQYHETLTEEQKQARDKVLTEKSKLGTATLSEKLATDKPFREDFRQKQKDGWEKAKLERPELHKERGEKISKRNLEYWSNPENKKKVFAKQTVVYPQSVFDKFCELLKTDMLVSEIINVINTHKNLLEEFANVNKHIKRDGFKPLDGLTTDHTNKMVRAYDYKGVRDLRRHLLDGKLKSISPEVEINTLYSHVTLSYPASVFGKFMEYLGKNVDTDIALGLINKDEKLMSDFLEANKNVQRKGIDLKQGLKRTHVSRMVKSYGYTDLAQAKEEATLYNHKVVSVEWLEEKQDTGTLTIDGKETLHNFHTFAINEGIFIFNSNLGEIDDAIYFRNKLFTALQFPKNYINQEDPQQTRVSLSAQDIKFARLIERLQAYMEDGLFTIADRHLSLRGFSEDRYEDLQIKLTPPSEWRELSRAEVITNRINNSGSLKGAQLLSDYDILIDWLKCPEGEAREKLARLKIQKIEDLKFQIMAQNPILLGAGTPGNTNEPEIGTEPGGPNPMLNPEGQPGGEQPPSGPEGQQQPPGQAGPPGLPMGEQPHDHIAKLPEVSEEDAKAYDLEIQSYDQDMDVEDRDLSTEE